MEYLDNLEAFLSFHIFLEFHVCLKQTSMQFHKVCIFKWSEFVDLLSDDKFKGDLSCFATTASGPRFYNPAVNLKYVELYMADQNMYVICNEQSAA